MLSRKMRKGTGFEREYDSGSGLPAPNLDVTVDADDGFVVLVAAFSLRWRFCSFREPRWDRCLVLSALNWPGLREGAMVEFLGLLLLMSFLRTFEAR